MTAATHAQIRSANWPNSANTVSLCPSAPPMATIRPIHALLTPVHMRKIACATPPQPTDLSVRPTYLPSLDPGKPYQYPIAMPTPFRPDETHAPPV